MFYAAAYFYLKKTLLTILICFLAAVKDDLILAKNDACLCKSGPRSKL